MKNLIFILTIFLSMSVSYQFIYAQWVQRYGIANADVTANSIRVDGSGNVYVTGSGGTIKYDSSGVQQWVQRYNGIPNYIINSMAVDGAGNVYITGFGLFIPFPPSTGMVTIKYSSSGSQQWVRVYKGGGGGNSIDVDGSGNVYVTGDSHFGGTTDNYVTIKYNSIGDSIWVKTYNGPQNSADYASSLAVDDLGNVYVTGYSGVHPNFNYATIKYNSNGDSTWVKRYNGPGNGDDQPKSIEIDGSGNVYVTGYSTGSGTSTDYATIKYNSNGDSIWVKRYNGPGLPPNDVPASIKVDSSGNVYITGYSAGSAPSYTSDYATIKYNSSGDSLWVQRYNGNSSDAAASLAVDGSGNVYVTGTSYSITTNDDYATIKYNSLGVQQWVQRYDGPSNMGDGATSIAIDASENVYVTGVSLNIWGNDYEYATIKYLQQSTATLDLTALIQGFYNNITQIMVRDTVRVYLRNISSPYLIVDSAKSVLDSTGYGRFNFPNAVNGTLYHIVIKHRNSIETWSSQGKMFSGYQLNFNFITAANKAFGNNLVLKGNYCIYSGDINQDGTVDLIDFSLVDNDVYNLVSGYVVTDVTGDNIVDLSDFSIVDNNAFNFVNMIRP